MTPSGIASPHFKTGLYASAKDSLPARIVADFDAAFYDPELESIRDSIAVAVARRNDLLKRVDTGESGEAWRSLQQTYSIAEKARRTWDSERGTVKGEEAKEKFFEAFETIGILISEGVADYRAWDEAIAADEHRRKLTDSERTRMKELGEMVPRKKAIGLVAGILTCLTRHVRAMVEPHTGRKLLAAVQKDVGALLGRGIEEAEPVEG